MSRNTTLPVTSSSSFLDSPYGFVFALMLISGTFTTFLFSIYCTYRVCLFFYRKCTTFTTPFYDYLEEKTKYYKNKNSMFEKLKQ